MRVGLRQLHEFITKILPPRLLKGYKNLQILNESDLQYEVVVRLRRFLGKDDDKTRQLEVHNCLSCFSHDGIKTYPDIVIFKRGKPWIVIELKEKGTLRQVAAEAEREKIHLQRQTLNAKRGYLIYIARWGKHRTMRGPKGDYKFRFFEVPVTLERDGMPREEIKEFQRQFHDKAKYVSSPALEESCTINKVPA